MKLDYFKRTIKKVWPLLIYFVFLLSIYPIFSVTNNANKEFLSKIITECALSSKSGAMNINIDYPDNYDKNDIASEISYSKDYTWNKYIMKNYTAKVVLDTSGLGTYSFPQISFSDSDEPFDPTVFLSNSFGNHQNDKGETIFDFFEIQLMFSDKNNDRGSFDNFCYITQDTANLIIGKDKPSVGEYESLLTNNFLEVVYENGLSKNELKWKISNIIVTGKYADYHYKETYGSYLIAYYPYLPSFEGVSLNFDFGTSYFNNKDYITSLTKKYSPADYRFSPNYRTIHLSNKEEIGNAITKGFRTIKNNQTAIFVLYPTLCILTVAIFVLIKHFCSFKKNRLFLGLSSAFFISYLLFFVLNLFSGTFIVLFTTDAIICSVISFTIICVLSLLFYDGKKTDHFSVVGGFYEINV